MADASSEPRAKRLRVDKNGRFAALEKLKQLKGNKHKYKVEEEVDNVYDIVDEREYVKKAKERYGNDWIEDDGTGYAEDGRDFFEDDDDISDEETEKDDKKKKQNRKRNREKVEKPKAGKGSIRSLFSNAVPKKKTQITSLAEDNILADILGEMTGNTDDGAGVSLQAKGVKNVIAPAKIVSVSTKRSEEALAKEYMNNFINNIKSKPADKQLNNARDDELIDRILKPNSKSNVIDVNHAPVPTSTVTTKSNDSSKVVVDETKVTATDVDKERSVAEPPVGKEAKQLVAAESNETCEFPDDDMDFSCISEETPLKDSKVAIEDEKVIPITIANKCATEEESVQNLLSNWESICQEDNFEEEMVAANESTTLATENLKFWYWEAWEDMNKRPGEVFLFGKTADGKSLCVHVENIDRSLYLLPREFLLDPITKEKTRQKVKTSDMYDEFNTEIASVLKLETFRSRTVTKSFAYHSMRIDVPRISEYLEIRYDGRKPEPSLKKKYNSIAHIFGANTSSLERFLLDRKIKGPCWLTLKQYRVNQASLSWCKADLSVSNPKFVFLSDDTKPAPPPPLTLVTLNVRTASNPNTLKNEVCMISMLTHNRYNIDKPAPQPGFTKHMCGFTRTAMQNWPFDLAAKMSKFKATRLYKHDAERSLLSWFLAQYQQLDADLIVTYDALDCQLDVLVDRIVALKIPQWSRLGRLRLTQHFGRKLMEFFIGRMVCDVKHSAEECIRSRSYDLNTLCQNVLKIKENERMTVNDEDLKRFYETGDGILKLITLTMQDASYILRLMYELNIMPLALQITNICGNTMTRTLQAGRSERNEFLLLHAFTEKNFIVPDKKKRVWGGAASSKNTIDVAEELGEESTVANVTGGRKKAAYSGGLVLDPIKGLYDKYVLLMDFNSLYPSIIQEYNICFTTVQQPKNLEELPELPDAGTEQGILPAQLRRLVESRREVKKLMAAPDLPADLKMQYHIRQMALKLTANSMYGCLGFAHSRFFAQHLAALVTHKGREILMNTKSLVQKMNYEVVYGDTDSIMVNTRIQDYEQVFKIGHSIKQSVNKMYKQLELDIDGVFSCLLLLKKKKYAAVKVSKNAKGELVKEQEHKGLDIVRRDWSQIAIMVGKVVLDEVLSEKQLDDKLNAVHSHLERVRGEILDDQVPLPMFIITKQLSKAPAEFINASSQSHVQVALRMNKTRNRRYKKGDMVDYIICEDGTANPATQRAYHLDELKTNENLKLDKQYYLAHQIHPVVTRMVDVLEGTDASRIAACLGLDSTKYRSVVQKANEESIKDATVETQIKSQLKQYRQCEKFKFICVACKAENTIASAFRPAASNTYEPVLQKCVNPDCSIAPYQYLISIRNQLQLTMRKFIKRFYQNWLVCDDPTCNQNTRFSVYLTDTNRPLCLYCKNGILVRQYSETDLYKQLTYFKYVFDLNQHQIKNVEIVPDSAIAYATLCDTVEAVMNKSEYNVINLGKVFSQFSIHSKRLLSKRLQLEMSHADAKPVTQDNA